MGTKKTEIRFVCQSCGYQTQKWLGRCPECEAWQTFVEERAVAPTRPGRKVGSLSVQHPVPLAIAQEEGEERLPTGINELDRVLGGGVVLGAMVLISGDPGIGKSTLLLQMLANMAGAGNTVLYTSGEESAQQVRMRGRRLNAMNDHLLFAAESSLEEVLRMAQEVRPRILAVDSIQTLHTEDIPSAPGSVSQVRETTAALLAMAKREHMPVILVGHVTKEGSIAGPKVLEHMVDTVLYFEGDRGHAFRILRAVKNRFGSTNEIGVFEMKEGGLMEVKNPSEIFLAERPINVPGSVVLPSLEGTRPILVEVQALVTPSSLGMPRRTAIGADQQRLSLLTAVLEKKVGISLFNQDIFLNIAGGIRIDEPALDLGMVCAIASSLLDKPVPPGTVVCGEVGLAGEIRGIGQIELRIQEAHRLGFTRALLPKSNVERLQWKNPPPIELIGVANIEAVLKTLF